MCVFSHVWLCNTRDCSPPDFSVHRMFQAKILEWVAISSSRGSSWPRDQSLIFVPLALAGGFFTTEPPGKPVYHSKEKNFRNIDLTRNIQNIYQQKKVKVTQSCRTLCDPMDYTVHGILQARILEWVVFSLLQGIFPTQGLNPSLPRCRQIFYQLNHKGSARILEWVAYPSPADLPDPGIEPESPALQLESLPTKLWGKPISKRKYS